MQQFQQAVQIKPAPSRVMVSAHHADHAVGQQGMPHDRTAMRKPHTEGQVAVIAFQRLDRLRRR